MANGRENLLADIRSPNIFPLFQRQVGVLPDESGIPLTEFFFRNRKFRILFRIRFSSAEHRQKHIYARQALLPVEHFQLLSLVTDNRAERIAASLVFTVTSKVRHKVLYQHFDLFIRPAKRSLISWHNKGLSTCRIDRLKFGHG